MAIVVLINQSIDNLNHKYLHSRRPIEELNPIAIVILIINRAFVPLLNDMASYEMRSNKL